MKVKHNGEILTVNTGNAARQFSYRNFEASFHCYGISLKSMKPTKWRDTLKVLRIKLRKEVDVLSRNDEFRAMILQFAHSGSLLRNQDMNNKETREEAFAVLRGDRGTAGILGTCGTLWFRLEEFARYVRFGIGMSNETARSLSLRGGEVGVVEVRPKATPGDTKRRRLYMTPRGFLNE